jgi:hypothetical protein
MKKCLYCIAALVLVVIALGMDFGAKSQFSKSLSLRASSIIVPKDQQEPLKVEASRIAKRGSLLAVLGLVFAFAVLVCLVISFRRHEPARWRSLPVALLIWYVMMQFMLV